MQKERNEQDFSAPIKEKNQAFFEDVLAEEPRDYRERNQSVATLLHLLTYPLQFASITAGSYLLWELGAIMWHLTEGLSAAMFVLCLACYCTVELVRRWLCEETGHYYYTTYNPRTEQGTWLQKPLIALFLISVLLVGTGTWGAVRYSQNNAPQQEKIDAQKIASPLLHSVQGEKEKIAHLDKQILNLQNNKAQELRDHRSYVVWNGKEYLLPETKTRHEGYDKQIATMQTQRQKHLDLLQSYEARVEQKEKTTQVQNQHIEAQNLSLRNSYGWIVGALWLGFEVFLLFCLAYKWFYKIGAKRYAHRAQPKNLAQKQSPPTLPIAPDAPKKKVEPKKFAQPARERLKDIKRIVSTVQTKHATPRNGGRRPISDEVKNAVLAELARKELTQGEIARKFDISPAFISTLKKQMNDL